MADDALAPTDNPFDQLDPDKVGTIAPPKEDAAPIDQVKGLAGPAVNDNQEKNPFDEFGEVGQTPTTAKGAFARGAERGVVPAGAGLVGAGLGGAGVVAAGAAMGTTVGPWGTLAGGIGGALVGGYLGSAAQDWALKRLPDSWVDALGMDDRQQKLDETQHSTASFLGGLTPYAVTMRPSLSFAATKLPENATALQKIMANPATARVFGGAAVGGMELGQEAAHGDVDWSKVAISTAFGVVFDKPTKFGEALTGLGERPFRPGEKSATVAQAGDAKVMGPGVTEDVFQGSHEQAPQAAMTVQEAARAEQAVMGEAAEPDVHAVAKQMHPELFDRYDELLKRRDILSEGGNPEHLAATNAEIQEIAPEISAAYRRAAETTGIETVEPEPFPSFAAMLAAHEHGGGNVEARAVPQVPPEPPLGEAAAVPGMPGVPAGGEAPVNAGGPAGAAAPGVPAPQRSLGEQKAFIADDVAQKLVAAGRPEDEARAAGQVVAARYATRAGRFDGKLGTAEELYRKEGAAIAGANGKAIPSQEAPKPEVQPAKRGPSARDENTFSLLEFLASRGGIRTDDPLISDLKQSFGGTNKFIPGFGQLIRPPKELSSAAKLGGTRAPMTLDDALRAAVDAGYLREEGHVTGGTNKLTPSDLLDTIDKEAHGNRRYKEGVAPKEVSGDEHFQAKQDQLIGEIENHLKESGGEKLTDAERQRAIELWHKEGLNDTADILERLALEADDAEHSAPERESIPGWDTAYEPQGSHAAGKTAIQARSEEPGSPTAHGGGERKAVDADLFQESEAKELEQTARGKIRLAPNARPLITLMKDANASTFMHESGHDFLEQMKRDAAHPDAPDLVKSDFETAKQWMGVKSEKAPPPKPGMIRFYHGTAYKDASEFTGKTFVTPHEQYARDYHGGPNNVLYTDMTKAQAEAAGLIDEVNGYPINGPIDNGAKLLKPLETDGELQTKHHEKFARGFEQYLREGVAPSQGLARVFSQFRNWLLTIYQSIKGLGAEISPEIRGVFDRMLEMEPKRTVIAPEERPIGGPALHEIHEGDAAHAEPHEAEALADRAAAERDRYIQEPPPEIAHEIAAATQKVETEQARAAGTEPGAEAGEGAGGQPEVDRSGRGPEPEPAGGGVGAGGGKVGEGRGGAETEGAAQPEPRSKLDDTPGTALAPGPADLFGASQSPFTDRAGNIRLDNLNTTEDVRQAIRDSAAENENFIGDRRGVITDGQVLELADALGMDAGRLSQRKLGQAFNAEQIIAARKLLIESATQVSAAMKKAAIGTDEDVMAYALAKDRHQMIQANVAGITAEAGRALRAFRKLPGQEAVAAVDQMLKDATGKTLFQLKAEAKMGAALDSPMKVSKFVQDAHNHSFGRMIMEYFVNNLISGPATHSTYMVGNMLLLIEKQLLINPTAAAIGAVRGAFGNEGPRVYLGETMAGTRGAIRGIAPALQAVGESFKAGVTAKLPNEEAQPALPLQPGTELAQAPTVDLNTTYHDLAYGAMRGMRDGLTAIGDMIKAGGVQGAPMIGAAYSPLGHIPDIQVKGRTVLPLGTLARAPSRMVASIHTFFRVLNYSAEINQAAYRAAVDEGHAGPALDARTAELRQSPTQEMMDSAAHTATDLTLMGQSGEFMKRVSRLFNWETNLPLLGTTQPLKFIDPFVQIAGQVVKQSVGTHTPLGLISNEVRADIMGSNGKRAQDLAMAKMLVGSVIGMTFGGLAAEGYMSGSGPTDPHEAAMWRLAGNQAHSVRIGDTWYNVHKLGPLGALASIAADIHDVAKFASEEDLQHAAASFMHAFTQNFLDEGFLKGPSDLLKAIEDSGRYGGSYVKNFLSSFTPYSVGLSQINQDPYFRQTYTILDGIKAKIPGLSETLHPRRNIWGEPMAKPGAIGGRGVTAIYAQHMSTDPVNQAMISLGIHPGPVNKKLRNVELTPEQYDNYARIAGRSTKMRLDAIVRSPDFRTWPDNIKHQVIEETIKQSREMATGAMFAKYPELPHQATEARRAKIRGEKKK